MIRITKQSDYGIVLLAHLARHDVEGQVSARDLAEATQLPVPMVSKILNQLVHGGLVVSTRGVNGGYGLARAADAISVAEVLDAVEGPLGLTECIDAPGVCGLEPCCSVRTVWRHINVRVRQALDAVSLAEMIQPLGPSDAPQGRFEGRRAAVGVKS
jgi:FeS assembly SUF system regulator